MIPGAVGGIRERLSDGLRDGLPGGVRAGLGRLEPDVVRESILGRLVVTILVVIVLVAAVGGYTYTTVSADLSSSTQDELHQTASLEANQLENWMNERRQITRMLSEYAVMQTEDPGQITTVLLGETSTLPDDVQGVYYIDTESQRVAASSDAMATGKTLWQDESRFAEGLSLRHADVVDRTPIHEGKDGYVTSFVSPVPGVENRAVVVTVNASHLASTLALPYEGGVVQVVDDQGTVEYDSSGELANEPYPVEDAAALAGVADGDTGVYRRGGSAVLDERQFVAYAPAGDMAVLIHVPTSSALALQSTVGMQIGFLLLVVLGGFAAVGLILKRTTGDPLLDLADRVGALREGDLDVDLPTDRRDEIGGVAAGIDRVRADLLDQRSDARAFADSMSAAAEGDLTVRLAAESDSADMETIAAEFNGMLADLEATVETVQRFGQEVDDLSGQLATGASEVDDATQEVAASIQQIADGATEQAERVAGLSEEMDNVSAGVEEIASTADELSALTAATAEIGSEGHRAAERALDGMETISDETERTVEEIRDLDDRLRRIGDVIEVITEIADQTDLLALNANIEAARAGEAGEGFAVVSNEVKALAAETQESAGDVEALIDDIAAQRDAVADRVEQMRESVEEGSDAVEEAIDALDAMVDRVDETDASAAEISAATDDQADSTQAVLATADEVASISQETTAEAESVSAAAQQQSANVSQVAAGAEQLATNARRLGEHLEQFETAADVDADAFAGDAGDGSPPTDPDPAADLAGESVAGGGESFAADGGRGD